MLLMIASAISMQSSSSRSGAYVSTFWIISAMEISRESSVWSLITSHLPTSADVSQTPSSSLSRLQSHYSNAPPDTVVPPILLHLYFSRVHNTHSPLTNISGHHVHGYKSWA